MNTEASFHTLFTPVIICQSKFVSEIYFCIGTYCTLKLGL